MHRPCEDLGGSRLGEVWSASSFLSRTRDAANVGGYRASFRAWASLSKAANVSRRSEFYYEEIGADFDRFMSAYDVERRAAVIADLFPAWQPTRSLEVGCGTGAITRTFRHRVTDLVVSDLSERLAQETAAANNAIGRAEDAANLSFDDGSFDLVITSECVEHLPDPPRAVGELLRVLKPGGQLILTTPNRLWLPLVLLAQRLRIRRFRGNESFLGTRELRSCVTAAGGEVLRHTGCHLLPWQLPGVKPLLRRLDRFGCHLYPVMINQAISARKRNGDSGCTDD